MAARRDKISQLLHGTLVALALGARNGREQVLQQLAIDCLLQLIAQALVKLARCSDIAVVQDGVAGIADTVVLFVERFFNNGKLAIAQRSNRHFVAAESSHALDAVCVCDDDEAAVLRGCAVLDVEVLDGASEQLLT